TNLAPGDTNGPGAPDVFLRDRRAGTTTLVSVNSRGALGDAGGVEPSVSANGRYVAFSSRSTNLVRDDANGEEDVFVRDLRTRRTTLVSVGRDRRSQGNADSSSPVISADGRYVAFTSRSTNFAPTAPAGQFSAYVKDLRTGALEWVSVPPPGARFDGVGFRVSMSADARYVVFVANEPPSLGRVYVRDRALRRTILAGVAVDGTPTYGGQASISASGRYVAFVSGWADGDPEVGGGRQRLYVRDLSTGTTVAQGLTSTGAPIDGDQYGPVVSDGGVAFDSSAAGIVPGDAGPRTQVYFRPF
ncbi:MAG TPA: hypothetical protein VF755_21110, partial [Catenuloplanes sp.]